MAVATVVSNSAIGGLFDSGGGISSAGPVSLQDLTIFGNQADFGGGLGAGAAEISNTILAGNMAGSGPDGMGTFTSGDYNLIQNTNGMTLTGAVAHNIIGRDPLLIPVRHESAYPIGQILIMVPQRGSPVIDQGDSLNSDQIPFQRPFDSVAIPNAPGGTGSDIGAIEYVPPIPFLNIERLNDGVLVHWSTNGIDFRLESTTNVVATNWSTVAVPAVVGDQFHVTNATVGPHKFYRLSAP